MDNNETWRVRGHIDRVFEYDKKQKFDQSGQKYQWIKIEPEEKINKLIHYALNF